MKIAIMAAEPGRLCREFLKRHRASLSENGIEVVLVLLDRNSDKSMHFWQHAVKVGRRQARKSGRSTAMGILNIATYKLFSPGSHGGADPADFEPSVPIVRVDTLNSPEACHATRQSGCDLVCLMGTRILTRKTLDAIERPIMNIHSSDPAFMRGSPSVVWEILAGYDSIVLTIHKVVPELDSGDIIYQAKHSIEFCGGLGGTVSRTLTCAQPVVADLFLSTILAFKTGEVRTRRFDPGPLRVTPPILQTLRADWICRWKTAQRRFGSLPDMRPKQIEEGKREGSSPPLRSTAGGKHPMKIILVHNKYREAGGEDVVFENEKRLLERNGHTVIPYLRSNTEVRDESLLDRLAIARQMVWSSKTRSEFAAILQRERPDLVHIHNTFMVISPSIYYACGERGIPVVQTLHNFRLLCPAANFFRHGAICSECVDQSLLRSVVHGCYRSRSATAGVAMMLAFHRALGTWRASVARFIALTEFARSKFVAAGFPVDKFVVKPNFTDPDPGERQGAGEYALFVGRLVENKGLQALLNAWKQLPAQYPLQIVGEGPEGLALEAQARELQLSGITFRGRLGRAAVIEAIKGARFVIVPSTWYEGFPMCIAESFACGTPVLCSRIGAMEEIVEDQLTGLHFHRADPQDQARKIEWAWNHPAELAEMGRAARRKYETHYTAEKNHSLLMEIYQQALATRATPRAMSQPSGDAPVLPARADSVASSG